MDDFSSLMKVGIVPMLAISSSSIAKASSSVRPRWFVFLLPHSVVQVLKSPPITIGSVEVLALASIVSRDLSNSSIESLGGR